MARLLTQGFETRIVEGLLDVAVGFTPSPRISGVAVEMGNLTFQLHDLIEDDITRNQFYTRFAYGIRINGSEGYATRFRIRDSANTTLFHISFGLNSDIAVHLNGATQPIATIPVQMALGWYVFEIYYNFTNESGHSPYIEIKLDGVSRFTHSDPTSSSLETPFERKLGFIDYCVATRAYLDDIAINDISGSRDNSWCGDGHVIALTPNANGDSSQFVGSDGNSTDNYLLVDDFPVNTADYVESSVVGMIDLYNVTSPTPALKTDDVVKRVWVSATARELSADGDTLRLGVKSGGTAAWSDQIPLGIDFREQRGDVYVNPSTGQPWTHANLDTLQVGVKPEVAVTPP